MLFYYYYWGGILVYRTREHSYRWIIHKSVSRCLSWPKHTLQLGGDKGRTMSSNLKASLTISISLRWELWRIWMRQDILERMTAIIVSNNDTTIIIIRSEDLWSSWIKVKRIVKFFATGSNNFSNILHKLFTT